MFVVMGNRENDAVSKANIVRRGKPFEKPGDLIGPALSLIPCVGGALAAVWSQWDTNQRFARVKSFLEELSKKIEALGNQLNPDNVGEVEMRLLEETAKRVASEHRKAKRKRFASLVVSTWTNRRSYPFEENMALIRALDEFDDLHINVLAFLKNTGDRCPSFTEIGDALGIQKEDRDGLLIPAIDRLASGYGFIKRGWEMSSAKNSGNPLGTKNLSPEGIARKCEHKITSLGIAFLNSIGEIN
jgi:hypothetical protein